MVSHALFSHGLVDEFAGVATSGLIPALLTLLGGLLFAVAFGVFGYLSLGGVLAALQRP